MSQSQNRYYSALFLMTSYLVGVPSAYGTEPQNALQEASQYDRAKCLWDLGDSYRQAALEMIKDLAEKGQDKKAQIKYIKKVGEYLQQNPLPIPNEAEENVSSISSYYTFLLPSLSTSSSVEEFREALQASIRESYEKLVPSFNSPDSPRLNIEEEIKKLRIKLYYSNLLEQLSGDSEVNVLRKTITQKVNTLSTKDVTAFQLYMLRYLREMAGKDMDGLKDLALEIEKYSTKVTCPRTTEEALSGLEIKIYRQLAKHQYGELQRQERKSADCEINTEKFYANTKYYLEYGKNKGDSKSTFLLAQFYETYQNKEEKWRKKAWDLYAGAKRQDYPLAIYKVAITQEDPNTPFNVEMDEDEAIECHKAAARMGHPLSQHRLFQYYQEDANKKEQEASKKEQEDATKPEAIKLKEEATKLKEEVIKLKEEAIKMLKLSAEGGYGVAQKDLGLYYLQTENEAKSGEVPSGEGKPYEQAFIWLNKAVQQNEKSAYKHLAKMYEEGLGVEKDYSKALSLYLQAYKIYTYEENIDSDLVLRLGQFYEEGYGLKEPDYQKAREYYVLAACRGCARAHYYLGRLYFFGKGVNQDLVAAYKNFQQADNNDMVACMLGIMNHFGLGTALNLKEAEKFLTQAAESNNIQAIEFLAYFYHKGLDGQINKDKALPLWEKGASLGSSDCAYYAGKEYLNQWRMTKDSACAAKAKTFFIQANEHPDALFYLGYIEEKGIIEKTHLEDVYHFAYSKAGKGGHLGALYRLGRYYENHPQPEERLKSAGFYADAIKLENAGALYALARIYQLELYGVTPESDNVYNYMEKANILSSQYIHLSSMRLLVEAGSEQGLKLLQQKSFEDNPFIQAYLAKVGENQAIASKNYAYVINLLEKAALKGSRSAARRLGFFDKYNLLDVIKERYNPELNKYVLSINNVPSNSKNSPEEIIMKKRKEESLKWLWIAEKGKIAFSYYGGFTFSIHDMEIDAEPNKGPAS